jgi:hypothetical protein
VDSPRVKRPEKLGSPANSVHPVAEEALNPHMA